MNRMDIAIVGTGPAGVSAAVTAKLRNKKVALFGSAELSAKMSKAHGIRNYTGLPDVDGAELAAHMRAHLDSMDMAVTPEQIVAVYPMGDYFALQGAHDIYEARSVVLASGVVMGKPWPGENELLGRGVSYCATCDGHLYKGKTVAVIGYSEESWREALYLAEVCGHVLYFYGRRHEVPLDGRIEVVDERPTGIEGNGAGCTLLTQDGSHEVSAVFVLRDAIAADQLVGGLATDGPHAVCDLQMATNIPGLFVAGDIAGKPYQYIKAAGQGNVAALSAVEWLARQDQANQ